MHIYYKLGGRRRFEEEKVHTTTHVCVSAFPGHGPHYYIFRLKLEEVVAFLHSHLFSERRSPFRTKNLYRGGVRRAGGRGNLFSWQILSFLPKPTAGQTCDEKSRVGQEEVEVSIDGEVTICTGRAKN